MDTVNHDGSAVKMRCKEVNEYGQLRVASCGRTSLQSCVLNHVFTFGFRDAPRIRDNCDTVHLCARRVTGYGVGGMLVRITLRN